MAGCAAIPHLHHDVQWLLPIRACSIVQLVRQLCSGGTDQVSAALLYQFSTLQSSMIAPSHLHAVNCLHHRQVWHPCSSACDTSVLECICIGCTILGGACSTADTVSPRSCLVFPDCRWPMKCHLMSAGSCSCLSTSSCDIPVLATVSASRNHGSLCCCCMRLTARYTHAVHLPT